MACPADFSCQYPPLLPSAVKLSDFLPLSAADPPPTKQADYERRLAWDRALRQFGLATTGSGSGPDTSIPIGGGAVGSITLNGDGKYVLTDPCSDFSQMKRCGVIEGPANTHLQIWFRDDPRGACHCDIESSPDPGDGTHHTAVLKDSALGSPFDWIDRGIGSGALTSLADLDGAQYAVYIDGDWGPYDRLPDPPNAREYIVQHGRLGLWYTQKVPGSTCIFPTAKLAITGSATAGSFTITIAGHGTTAAINFNFTLADLVAAVAAVDGDSAVVPYAGGYAIAFGATHALAPAVSVANSLIGAVASASALSNVVVDSTDGSNPAVLGLGYQNWKINRFTGPIAKDPNKSASFSLMVQDSGPSGDGRVRRFAIVSNDANSITTSGVAAKYTSNLPSLNSYFSVVGNNSFGPGYWNPQARSGQRNLWYSGAYSSTFGKTHWAVDDGIGNYAQPAILVSLDTTYQDASIGVDCLDPPPLVIEFDSDVRNDCEGPTLPGKGCCEPCGILKNPTLPKSDRWVQNQLAGFGAPWVDPLWDPAGGGSERPLPLTFPVMMRAAGINSFNAFITSVSADHSRAYLSGVMIPYSKAFVYYKEVSNDTIGNEINYGDGATYPQQDLTGVFIAGSFDASHVGRKLICTWGWPNPFRYGHRYNEPRQAWIPTVVEDLGGNLVAVDPPVATGGQAPKPRLANWQANQAATGPVSSPPFQVTGSLLAAFVTTRENADPGSGAVSDSQGNAWTQSGYVSIDDGSGNYRITAAMYYATSPVGAMTSVTFAPTSGVLRNLSIIVIDVIGADQAAPFDINKSDTSTGSGGTNPTDGSNTTGGADEILFSFAACAEADTGWTLASGYSNVVNVQSAAITAFALETRTAATVGSYGSGFTIQSSQPWASWTISIARGTLTDALGGFGKRPASTNYARWDLNYGRLAEEGPAFALNDRSRYYADQSVDAQLAGISDASPLVLYVDKWWKGTCGAVPPNPRYAGKEWLDGSQADGAYFSTEVASDGTGLIDAGPLAITAHEKSGVNVTQVSVDPNNTNWFETWFDEATPVTISGTATGGTANTLIDSGAAFTLRAWGRVLSVTHSDGGTPPTLTTHTGIVDGASTDGHTLHFPSLSGGYVPVASDTYSFSIAGGTIFVDGGAVSSGTSTSIIDSTRAGAPGSPLFKNGLYNCDPGLTLRIYHPVGDGSWTLHKFLISGATQSLGKLTFDAIDGFVPSAGDRYEIDWPGKRGAGSILNRWQEVRAIFTRPDKTTKIGRAIANDQNTAFLYTTSRGTARPISEADIPAGTTIEFQTFLPGSVLKWDGNDWNIPTGQDSRTDPATGNQPQYPKNPMFGLSNKFNWFGPIHPKTIMGAAIANAMWLAIKTITVWAENYTYTNKGLPDSRAGDCTVHSAPATMSEVAAGAVSSNISGDFNSTLPTATSGGGSLDEFGFYAAGPGGPAATANAFASYSLAVGVMADGGSVCGSSGTFQTEVAISKQMAYLQITKPVCLAQTVKYYSLGGISIPYDRTEPPSSVFETPNAGGSCDTGHGCDNSGAGGVSIQTDEYTGHTFTPDAQVRFHQYTLIDTVGPDTNATDISTIPLGDISSPPPPPTLPTFHPCDLMSITSGWNNVDMLALRFPQLIL